MCYGCWDEAGKPLIDNIAVRNAVEAVRVLYTVEPRGRGAHIVTDDWNLEDDDIDWCLQQDGCDPLARAALEALRPLSMDERFSVLAIVDGFADEVSP